MQPTEIETETDA